jgi:hypothetical protein
MRQAKVNLNKEQLHTLCHGGVLVIRLHDTEIKLTATHDEIGIWDAFENFLKEFKI